MENKNTIIAICVGCCLFITLIIACTRGCNSKDKPKIEPPKTVIPQTTEKKVKKDNNYTNNSYTPYSGGENYTNYGEESGEPPSLLSEEDKKELIKSYDEDDKLISKLKKEWMENKLKDPNLSEAAKEQFKLRSNPSFLKGMRAYENMEYDQAIIYFNEILKDPNASPVSKYFACMKLMDIGMKKKDIDLYFIAARMRETLKENEDLSAIGMEKSDSLKDWFTKVEYTLKAKNDPTYFEKCVEMKLAKTPGKNTDASDELLLESIKSKDFSEEKSRQWAREQVKKEIQFYSEKYKELIN